MVIRAKDPFFASQSGQIHDYDLVLDDAFFSGVRLCLACGWRGHSHGLSVENQLRERRIVPRVSVFVSSRDARLTVHFSFVKSNGYIRNVTFYETSLLGSLSGNAGQAYTGECHDCPVGPSICYL